MYFSYNIKKISLILNVFNNYKMFFNYKIIFVQDNNILYITNIEYHMYI